MYDTWGGTSKILDARGLWKKLSPLEGFGPPTDFQVSWRIWLGVTLRTDEWENLEPEIASKAKRSAAAFNFATANGDVLKLESSHLWYQVQAERFLCYQR